MTPTNVATLTPREMARGAVVLLCVLDTTLRIRAVAQNGLNATAARADSTVAAFEGVDYVLVHHFPKSGGSSLRQIVCEAAQRRGWPMALCYDGHAPLLATCYDERAPARVIMGHSITARFHATSLPPRAKFAYVSMLRAPAAWLVSDYLHHRSHELARLPTDAPRAAAAVCAWLRAALAACPVVSVGATNATRGAGCGAGASGHERHDLAQWARFLPARDAHGAAVARAVALVLINERYAESLEMLEVAFELKRGSLKPRHSNAREQSARGRCSLGNEA